MVNSFQVVKRSWQARPGGTSSGALASLSDVLRRAAAATSAAL